MELGYLPPDGFISFDWFWYKMLFPSLVLGPVKAIELAHVSKHWLIHLGCSVESNGAEMTCSSLREWVSLSEWVCGHIAVILELSKDLQVASASPISGAKSSVI